LVEGEALDVKVGDEVAVVLDENPSTGYGWAYKEEPEGLLKEVGKESKSLSEERLIGAGVTSVWKFKAVSEGEVKLTYLYYRPWEGEETAVHKKEFIIKIKE
jgi:inhibitor of cysteine peptidase